jgi:hypothetical protein
VEAMADGHFSTVSTLPYFSALRSSEVDRTGDESVLVMMGSEIMSMY